ncbi:MAG: TolC family protein [Burkholderiales bacterium]|nr:TolC family protein [Burkholderiales bacterium]
MKIGFAPARARRACVSAGLIVPLVAAAQPHDPSIAAAGRATVLTASAPAAHAGRSASDSGLEALLAEAIEHNPEIRAARSERAAARARIAPAGALDDPMVEAGIVNLPAASPSLAREDMTMKILGLSQRIPYPGKRGLKHDVAVLDSESLDHAYAETVNRVVRDARVAYYELALVHASRRLIDDSRALVRQLLKVADARYAVGRGNQVDVLRGQTQLSKLSEEVLKLERERATATTELARMLGRDAALSVVDARLESGEVHLDPAQLRAEALSRRPQLRALESLVARNRRSIDLAKTGRYPDFDLRLSYGQRDRMPGGPGRSDLVSVTVAMNLPIWEGTKTQPRIAEAAALHEQALSLLQAQRNETVMRLGQQIAAAKQSLRTARLYRSEIIPQAYATIDAAISAYQVGRSDFALLLDNQMALLNFQLGEAAAVAAYDKALAEIDFVTGRAAPALAALGEGEQR